MQMTTHRQGKEGRHFRCRSPHVPPDSIQLGRRHQLLPLEVFHLPQSPMSLKANSSQDAEAQTDPRTYEDADCQAGASCSAEVQTDSAGPGPTGAPEVDYGRLAAFLRRVCPGVLAELDKAERSRAFLGYEPAERADDDDCVRRLHSLLTPELRTCEDVKVGGLAWSCTGRVVAVGYGRREHEAWCDHSGAVHLFNISRHDFSPSSPGQSLRTGACVTCLAAHPSQPSVLAVGTFSGEVSVWDVQSGAQLPVGSSAGGHQDAVSQLCWVRGSDPVQPRLLLASAGRDGRLFLWQADPVPPSGLRPVDGFVVTLEHGGAGAAGVQASPLGGRASAEVGVASLGFSPHEPGSFVAGLEGGGLLRCSTLLARQSAVPSEIPLKDPVLTAFEGHRGTVTCVRHSPRDRGLFLSCDASEIHLHDEGQAGPLRVIHPAAEVLGVEWLDARPHLLLAWGPGGTLEYHCVGRGQAASAPVPLSSEERDAPPVAAVSFSPRSGHKLAAVGDGQGRVSVWKVPRAKDPSLADDALANAQ